jgi:hypothetical protein
MPKTTDKPAPTPPALTWNEINRLAEAVAMDLTELPDTAACLAVLMSDINAHPQENQETIATLLSHHLFSWQPASNKPARDYIARERARVLKAIEKGGK